MAKKLTYAQQVEAFRVEFDALAALVRQVKTVTDRTSRDLADIGRTWTAELDGIDARLESILKRLPDGPPEQPKPEPPPSPAPKPGPVEPPPVPLPAPVPAPAPSPSPSTTADDPGNGYTATLYWNGGERRIALTELIGGRRWGSDGQFTAFVDRFGLCIENSLAKDYETTILSPVDIVLAQGGNVFRRETLQNFGSGRRWRHRFAPASDLGAIPPRFIPTLAPIPAGSPLPKPETGTPRYMHATGQQNNMGWTRREAALWLLTRDAAQRDAMIAIAEDSANFPVHLRRPDYSQVDLYADTKEVFAAWGVDWKLAPENEGNDDWTPDIHHGHSTNYVMYLATRDPFHLDQMQAIANAHIAWYGALSRPTPWGGVRPYNYQQVREAAWGLRTLLQAWATAPEPADCPRWLLPRPYWARRLAECFAHMVEFAVNVHACFWTSNGYSDAAYQWPSDAAMAIRRAEAALCRAHIAYPGPAGGADIGWWQEADLDHVLGIAKWLGYTDPNFERFYDWHVAGLIERCLTPIWQVNPVPYDGKHWFKSFDPSGGKLASSVAEAGAMEMARLDGQGSLTRPVTPGVWSGSDYFDSLWPALAMAAINRVPRAADALAWAKAQRDAKRPKTDVETQLDILASADFVG